ncbi:hypothetical protein GCM10009416_40760 [Craurococcus roseus]|uniref:DUF5872 domain-containing protein n=1 Tax=Craurococcus roseus TaxID=77585 RepID=A0ABN1FVR5_9PROT
MAGTAEKTDPKLWDRVKKQVTASDKGGRKGQWSARKAQLASAEYKKKGGGYQGRKTADNHLAQWTKEDWGTKSGRASRSTGERYLPRRAREKLSDEEYGRSTAAKRRDTAKGKQFSRQPTEVARKMAGARKTGAAAATAAKRRPAAKATTGRKAATPRTAAVGRKAAPAKPTARKATTATRAKAPARRTAAAGRKAAPAKAARKPATRKPAAGRGTARKPAATARKAASGAARKSAARKPAAKRTAAAARSTRGGSKR